MHMHMILVDPDLPELPVLVVFPHFLDLHPQRLVYTLTTDLAAESGQPHNVVLRLVDRVCRFVELHAAQSTGSCGPLLAPPPLQAGTFRWIRCVASITRQAAELNSRDSSWKIVSKISTRLQHTKRVVQRFVRPIDLRCIFPLKTLLIDIDDPTDHR